MGNWAAKHLLFCCSCISVLALILRNYIQSRFGHNYSFYLECRCSIIRMKDKIAEFKTEISVEWAGKSIINHSYPRIKNLFRWQNSKFIFVSNRIINAEKYLAEHRRNTGISNWLMKLFIRCSSCEFRTHVDTRTAECACFTAITRFRDDG